MRSELAPACLSIAPMSSEAVARVRCFENILRTFGEVNIATQHLLHGGMYARTVLIPAGVVATGVLIKAATILIVDGDCSLFVGDATVDLSGRHVLAGAPGRKQAIFARTDTYVTMVLPSMAKSVADAEHGFTDEVDALQSRRRLLKEGAQCLV